MARFFSRILRNGSIPVFLILELVCLLLIVRFNSEQQSIAHYTLGRFQGRMQKIRTTVSLQLSMQNHLDSMAAVQARLLENCLSANEARFSPFSDSLKRDSLFIVAARVINNSISHRNNYMTLDKGRLDGVEKGMGVFTIDGPVGIVRATSDHYSLVMSLLHQQSRLSVALKEPFYFGSLVWSDLRNPRQMYLEDIPRHAQIAVGDTVQTTGFSDIFPAAMLVGVVDTFWVPPASDFYEIKVNLLVDIAGLRNVYVVKKLGMEEKQVLEESLNHE